MRDANDAVTFYEGTVVDITERKLHEEELKYQATHDSLTGLPNRILLLDRIQHFSQPVPAPNMEVPLRGMMTGVNLPPPFSAFHA